ncbi:MAG: methyl-accepting chemotaxis protein [Bacillota bacterium]
MSYVNVENQEAQLGVNTHADVLNWLVQLAPFFQQLVPIDCIITVSDKEKFLLCLPGRELGLGELKEGMPIPKGSNTYQVLNSGTVSHRIVPKEVYGVRLKSSCVPVKDAKGSIIGAMALGVSLGTQDALFEVAQTVANSSRQVLASTEELRAAAESLAKQQDGLQVLAKDALDQIKNTEKILAFINDISTNSNLLGLNAAIEAARAGEHGRGFSVVAEEIRKMAVNSARSVNEIKEILHAINNKLQIMGDRIKETAAISQQHAAATEEISAAIHEIASTAKNLEKVAEVL